MSNTRKSSQTAVVVMFLLLIVPLINWIAGTLFAASAGLRLLSMKRWARLFGLFCGATLWGLLSFYLLIFQTNALVALGTMLVFFAWTWILQRLIEQWVLPDESVPVSLAGRIES